MTTEDTPKNIDVATPRIWFARSLPILVLARAFSVDANVPKVQAFSLVPSVTRGSRFVRQVRFRIQTPWTLNASSEKHLFERYSGCKTPSPSRAAMRRLRHPEALTIRTTRAHVFRDCLARSQRSTPSTGQARAGLL